MDDDIKTVGRCQNSEMEFRNRPAGTTLVDHQLASDIYPPFSLCKENLFIVGGRNMSL